MIPDGKNQRLFVVNSKCSRYSPGVIACISEDNYKDLIQLYKAINAYARNRVTTDFGVPQKHGVIFLAFCNGQWHRALVVESCGDGAPLCKLIDLHSEQKIKVKNIIPMPVIFSEPPLMTQKCTVEGFKDDPEFQGILESRENTWIEVDEVKNEEDDECRLTINSIFKSQETDSNQSFHRSL